MLQDLSPATSLSSIWVSCPPALYVSEKVCRPSRDGVALRFRLNESVSLGFQLARPFSRYSQ
jgi:hypothetical protein